MFRRFRILLPPAPYLIAVLVLVLMPLLSRNARDGRYGSYVFLCMAAFGLGMFRVQRFHPAGDPAYRKWLTLMPWTAAKPLPCGPVQLMWEDLVLIGLLGVGGELILGTDPMLRISLRAFVVPAVFLFAYTLMLSAMLGRTTAARPFGYLVCFGLGLAIRLGSWPVAAGCALLASVLVARWGLARSLRRFHEWDFAAMDEQVQKAANRNAANNQTSLGWPFDRIAPKFAFAPTTKFADVLLSSLLLGWWMHAVLFHAAGEGFRIGRGLFATFAIGFAVVRCFLYLVGYSPPISLGGRIATLRPIIPGYDKVFIAPFLLLLLGFRGPETLLDLGVPPDMALPIAMVLTLVVGLTGGPSLQQWRLTGRHRIAPGISQNNGNTYVQTG